MIKIKIEDTLYNVPEGWNDVTLGQYEKWFDYVADTKMKEVELVSLISTIPFDLLSTLPLSFYTDVLNMVSFAFAGNDFKPSNKILIDDEVYSVSIKDELTLAQYVDVEATFEEEGNDSRLSEILAIVCLRKGEKYDSKILKERKKLFQDLKMNEVFPLLAFFFAIKKELVEDYNILFKGSGTGKPICKPYQDFSRKWGWYKVIAEITKDEIQKFDEVTNQTVITVFNFLCYRLDKVQAEEAQYKFEEQLSKNKK